MGRSSPAHGGILKASLCSSPASQLFHLDSGKSTAGSGRDPKTEGKPLLWEDGGVRMLPAQELEGKAQWRSARILELPAQARLQLPEEFMHKFAAYCL